jgi:hypothetical protein
MKPHEAGTNDDENVKADPKGGKESSKSSIPGCYCFFVAERDYTVLKDNDPDNQETHKNVLKKYNKKKEEQFHLEKK